MSATMLAALTTLFQPKQSSQTELILALSLVITLLLVYWLFVYPLYYGPLSHVPGPWPSKISSLFIALYDLLLCRNDHIYEWHQRYGPVVCIAPNEVSVATLEATRDVYGSTSRWAKSSYFDNFMQYNQRSIFATRPYNEHRKRRKLTAAFYQASSVYKRPEIEERIRDRVHVVLDEIYSRHNETMTSEVDIYCLTDWFALDNITHLVLGPRHCTQTVERPCLERQILQELKYLQLWGPLRLRFPSVFVPLSRILGRLIPRLSFFEAEDKLADWSYRRFTDAANDSTLPDSHTLVQRLLKIGRQRDDKTEPPDHEFIAAEVLDNINAAQATIAVTATYLIWQLSEHSQWQRRLREELRALPVRPEDHFPSFADVNDHVPVLEACLREVYRLHPASSGRAERIVPNRGHALSGIYLPGKAIVTTSVVSIHRDKNVFPMPDRFVPERWLDGEKSDLKTREAHLIPFGYGGRICLGKPFATMEIKMLMAGVYLRYETLLTASSTSQAMKQCSTHDAVPRDLQCMIRFRDVSPKETTGHEV